MLSKIRPLVQFCMAGVFVITLIFQGNAVEVFAEIPIQTNQTVSLDENTSDSSFFQETVDLDIDTSPEEGEDSKPTHNKTPDDDFSENETQKSEENEQDQNKDPEGETSDIQEHWAKEIFDYWMKKNIVAGYPDGTLRPDIPITRAEAAALTAKIRQLVSTDALPVFSDVPEDHWAFQQIQSCCSFGILKGMGNGVFLPEESITREAAMTILYRASSFDQNPVEESFKDVPDQDEFSDWAREAGCVLHYEGIITGDQEGRLNPGENITRAEFLTMLYRMEIMETWDPSICGTLVMTDLTLMTSLKSNEEENSLKTTFTVSDIGEPVFILPECADLHQIDVQSTLTDLESDSIQVIGTEKAITGTSFDLMEISSPDEDGAYPLTISITDKKLRRNYSIRVFCGTSLDTIFLTSEEGSGGRSYVEEERGNQVKGSMQMISGDGNILYNGELNQLKSRGNSTFGFPKKPYQIKLDHKTDLIGNGEKEKTWVLLANYVDPTMIKDKLCKDLAADFQLPGSPDSKWVDLYFDGEYRGVYLLTEKINISSSGLNITNLEEMYEEVNEEYGEKPISVISDNQYGDLIQFVENLTDPEDISNGYLIELNNSQYDEISGFITRRGIGVNIKAPEYLSEQAVSFISEFYQEFEDAVYSVNQRGSYTGINTRTNRSFTEYCDLESLAKMYLIYQFSLNADAYFGSTYFYMENDILHQGPVWDSDLSFGVFWNGVQSPTRGLQNSYLSEALEKIPLFQKTVKEIYDQEFRELELKYTVEKLKEYQEILSVSECRNHLIWPKYYKTAILDSAYPEGTEYETVIRDLQEWMTSRIEYLDQKFKKWG